MPPTTRLASDVPVVTQVSTDLQDWARWVDRLPRTKGTLLFIDAAVAGSALDRNVGEVLDRRGAILRRVVGPRTDIADLRADHSGVGDDLVVGVGGGGVMDRAKLVALLAGDRQAELRLTSPHRCGFIAVPSSVRRRVPLALIPTTIGTGADLSRSACVEVRQRKRLVFGEALRADSAVHIALATDLLPTELVAEGILEALLRLSAAYVGSLGDLPGQDSLVEGYVARLVQLGDAVRTARDARVPVPGEVRLAAARISAASHTEAVLNGRDRYCDISWPLAHELSSGTGSRKLIALAALTPAVWQRISAGDERLGAARRLDRLWVGIRLAAQTELGPVPADGLAMLTAHWGIDTRIDTAAIAPDPIDADPIEASGTAAEALAGRADQTWGRGLPMLKSLSRAEISAIYADALKSAPKDLSTSRIERRKCNA